MIVSLLCFLVGIKSEKNLVFIAIGGFWVVIAIIVRSKNKKKKTKKVMI